MFCGKESNRTIYRECLAKNESGYRQSLCQPMKPQSLLLVCLGTIVSASAQTIFWPSAADLARQRSDSIRCVNNLKQIFISARIWAGDNGDAYPPRFQDFTNELSTPQVLFCRANHRQVAPTNWTDLDWGTIDYEWIQQHWWDVTNVSCQCLVHSNYILVDGSAHRVERYRSGWPAITASPLSQNATPGSTVRLQVLIAPDAQLPVSYQWRKQHLVFSTNAIYYPDPGIWFTNITSSLVFTNLPGKTNPTLVLSDVQITNSDSYAVAISNALGVAVSTEAPLWVDPAVPSMATNEYWSAVNCINNLQAIALFAKLWAGDHADHMPSQLSIMTNAYGSPVFGWPTVLYCRSDAARTAPTNWADVNFDDTSYEVLPGNDQDPAAAFCRCKIHGYYARMDGAVVSRANFTGIRPLAPNARELTFAVWPGRTNVLETSNDLITWTTLQEYSPTNGLCRFDDTNSIAQRFYRVRTP